MNEAFVYINDEFVIAHFHFAYYDFLDVTSISSPTAEGSFDTLPRAVK